jgi:hypothetical protein
VELPTFRQIKRQQVHVQEEENVMGLVELKAVVVVQLLIIEYRKVRISPCLKTNNILHPRSKTTYQVMPHHRSM